MSIEKTKKNEKKYRCELCAFVSCKKTDYNRHLLTAKHEILQNTTNKNEKNENIQEHKYYFCNCGKQYRHHSSLWTHKKTCKNQEASTLDDTIYDLEDIDLDTDIHQKNTSICNIDDNSIITELKDIIIKQQAQIEKQQEQIGSIIPLIGNKTINNTQNNKFSIKMFLDEKCKDAINMTDFVNSIKVSLEQLEYTTEHGLTDGLTKTIMDNMNRLSIYERPLHCTDVKRETLYIKDDDKWSKDNSRERMKLAIKGATNANYRALKDWQGVHPDFRKDERLTEYFTDMIVKLGKSLHGIDDKVLRNICRSTYLRMSDIDID